MPIEFVNFQIWVPSFQDSDGDGYGDIKGVIDRMEHLRKSGVQVEYTILFNAIIRFFIPFSFRSQLKI